MTESHIEFRIPDGTRVWVKDELYSGPALVLEYDPIAASRLEVEGPYYCHLLDNCDHEQCDDDCQDECWDADCRAWVALNTVDYAESELVPGFN